ncbi:superoxide dismutase-like protein [White-tailed deer poxvirus]|nr:superoxide dismutase-like protein [White-tailed deer poxvirus]
MNRYYRYYEFNKVIRRAVCLLKGTNIQGVINFEQLENGINIIFGVILGLREGYHGIHIHELGDETDGASSCGSHFNPNNRHHGSPNDEERHIGDLGNIYANKHGISYVYMIDGQISLDNENSIIGRALIVKENEDDFGRGNAEKSRIDGNSGKGIAWGIIGISN